MNRRKFVKRLAGGTLLLGSGGFPFRTFANTSPFAESKPRQLTILHTNDTHSRIDPFPSGSKYAGLGGAARRAALVSEVRAREEHVLLLDAGDFFQGTPYFNFFKGEVELQVMSAMKYDAATLGNHDFDAGTARLAEVAKAHATFPFINCNYDFSDTPMDGLVSEYLVVQKGGLRIGITGAGIELDGLVPKAWTSNIGYRNPVENVNRVAAHLRNEEGCHCVILLSHLGYRYKNEKISDVALAGMTKDVDLIIGGHTHTFLDAPEVIKNAEGQPVLINQVGWGGILLGRIDMLFEPARRAKTFTYENLSVKPK